MKRQTDNQAFAIDTELERQIGLGLSAWADQLKGRNEMDLRATMSASAAELFRRHGPNLPRDLRELANIFENALRRGTH